MAERVSPTDGRAQNLGLDRGRAHHLFSTSVDAVERRRPWSVFSSRGVMGRTATSHGRVGGLMSSPDPKQTLWLRASTRVSSDVHVATDDQMVRVAAPPDLIQDR